MGADPTNRAAYDSVRGVIGKMTARMDAQAEAALAAAEARRAIAKRIATLTPKTSDGERAQMVLQLAEAYAHLAVEPPRARGD